jgi:hypothetical protein
VTEQLTCTLGPTIMPSVCKHILSRLAVGIQPLQEIFASGLNGVLFHYFRQEFIGDALSARVSALLGTFDGR